MTGTGIYDLVAYYLLTVHGLDYFQETENERNCGAGLVGGGVVLTEFAHAKIGAMWAERRKTTVQRGEEPC